MEEDKALTWISLLQKEFLCLSCEDKNRSLDYLIDHLDAAQLYHLSIQLERLLTRDFIVQLPKEVAFHLLSFLDTNTLLKCCTVSKSWHRVISECQTVWKRACYSIGLDPQRLNTGDTSIKSTYLQKKKVLSRLQNGSLFSQRELFGHMDRVMAVHYSDGLLATGSDDHTVRLWDCATSECIRVLRTHSVADLKLCGRRVFTASFDTTAACWDIDTGQAVTRYTGHVGAVFSVDLLESLDALVTGSADSTVKLWQLSTGQLLKTLTQHRSAWITHVFLFYLEPAAADHPANPSTSYQGIVSKSNNNHPNQHQSCSNMPHGDENDQPSASSEFSRGGGDSSKKIRVETTNITRQRYFIVSQDNMSLHLWAVDTTHGDHAVSYSEEWQNNTGLALLPGLWKHGAGREEEGGLGFRIAFVDCSVVHLYDCVGGAESGGRGGLSLSGIRKLRECVIPQGMYPQTFLASGDLFDVLLADKEELNLEKGPQLLMLHTRNKDMNASVSLPINYRPSKRGSTMTVCGRSWLSHLPSTTSPEQPVFAITLKDNRVYLVHFNKDQF